MSKINETINSPSQTVRSGIPQLIVKHICDGTYEGTKSWFLNPASEVSSHFVVAKDGRICQCVPLTKTAWCNGTSTNNALAYYFGNSLVELIREQGGNANHYSVSIEFEGFYSQTGGALTEAQIEADIWLTKHIRDEIQRIYNHTIPLDRRYLVGHNEVSPRTRPNCPGQKFPWAAVMAGLQGASTDAVLYRVQVGAFGNRANAENFLKNIVLPKGVAAFIAPPGKDGLYRIQVGAFTVKANAQAFLSQVRNKGLEAFLVVESR